ncbi:DUF695 domain-containing protein [Polaromonas sp.]|uniref:DUF695 domain-containing protein n=1 Tax=Polaromonas sp. TaxID=1869339 RepID=UPI003C8786BD
MFESADTAVWAIAEGHTGEYPFQVRSRRFSAGLQRSEYPKRLNIFWSMRLPNEAGLATKAELDDLHIFENRLVAAVEQDQSVILAAVLTGRAEREFVFYLQQPQLFLKRLTNMPQEQERYPIEIHFADDPDWAYFDELLPNGG